MKKVIIYTLSDKSDVKYIGQSISTIGIKRKVEDFRWVYMEI